MKLDQLNRRRAEELSEYGDVQDGPSSDTTADELISLDPVMRYLMDAAQQGFGDYRPPRSADQNYDSTYWRLDVKPWALRAIGKLTLGAEAVERVKPDSPDLVADQLHPWVWQAAAPLWDAGNRQEAVHAAARSVNARLQQKLGRRDAADAKLCCQAFSLDDEGPRPTSTPFCRSDPDLWRLGAAARTAATSWALDATRAYATRLRTSMDSTFPTRLLWSSSLPSACWPAGLTSAL